MRIIRSAIDNGITFMDNSWDYNEGKSQVRIGRALRDGYRERAFLMTKIDGRDRSTAAHQIDESLNMLQTDHVDLLQFHESYTVTTQKGSLRKEGRLKQRSRRKIMVNPIH